VSAVAAPPGRDGPDPVRSDPARSDPAPPDLRWVLARERTLLAWFRVSLALFVLGLVPLVLVPPDVATLPVSLLSAALMIGCAATAITGVRRWHAEDHHDRPATPPPAPAPTPDHRRWDTP
jgi:putative membrane protein